MTGRARWGDEQGGAVAEFAVAMPAVMMVLALLLGGVQVGGAQLRAIDAAADAARSWARGDSADMIAARLERQLPGARVTRSTRGDLVCATVTSWPQAAGARLGIEVRGWACALSGGR